MGPDAEPRGEIGEAAELPDAALTGSGPRWLALALSLTLTAVILIVLSRFVDFSQIPTRLAATDLRWIPPIALGAVLFGVVVQVHKWTLILRAQVPAIRFRDALFARMGSSPLVILLPLRAGEVVPLLYLWRRHGVPIATSLGTLVFDKVTNILAMLVLGLIGAIRADVLPPWIPGTGIALICIGLIPSVHDLAVRWLRLDRTRLAEPLAALLACFRQTPPRLRVLVVAYGILMELGFSGLFVLCLVAQGVPVPLDQALFLTPVMLLVANLTILGLGSREAMALLLFGQWASAEQLVGATAMFLLLEVVLVMTVGVALLQPLLHRVVLGKETP